MMHWSEVQRLYPDQFILLEELSSHYKDDKLYVEEVAIVRPIQDADEAMVALLRAHDERFIYHTSKEQIIMEVRLKPAIRGYSVL